MGREVTMGQLHSSSGGQRQRQINSVALRWAAVEWQSVESRRCRAAATAAAVRPRRRCCTVVS